MAHQYMPKIFHGPHKNPPATPPTYLMYGPLTASDYDETYLFHFYNSFCFKLNEIALST